MHSNEKNQLATKLRPNKTIFFRKSTNISQHHKLRIIPKKTTKILNNNHLHFKDIFRFLLKKNEIIDFKEYNTLIFHNFL